ncbi:hypothetical protein RHOSPDRAFT_33730 [Rhodotorula sp. JG-1b]|nr:hypothetical protein RHOSPDRAFT_33730 [Rhodotorula sp. JG-1b]
MPPATLDPYHDERRISSDRSYATYGTQSHARSDPYLVASSGAAPSPAAFVRRQSGPAESGGPSLLPLDQAVRLDRERSLRAASTTALQSWPNGHHGPGNPSSPSSSGNAPFASSSTSARAAGPTPAQQTPTRKLTKHRRSSSGSGRTVGPSSPTPLAHTPPHFSPAAPPSWQATNPYESAAVPRPHVANSPYSPPSNTLRHNPSYAQPQQSIAQRPVPPQAGYHTYGPSAPLHLSPYPPVRPPLPALPVRSESEEQQIERARRESLEAEQARIAALAAAEDHLLQLTLAESESAAARERERERDRLAASELRSMEEVIRASREQEERRRWEQERQRQAEEEAMARAIEASRGVVVGEDGFNGDKDKGKASAELHSVGGHTSAQDVDEDEALELAMRLSLDEAARQHRWQQQAQTLHVLPLSPSTSAYNSYGTAETSAQAFERYSRPAAPPSAESANPSASSLPRRGMSLLLDDELGVPAGETLDDSTAPPPPAYEFPAHAAELDQPGDVIVGPGRPLPPTPFPSSPPPRPLPTPPILSFAIPPQATAVGQLHGHDESPASDPTISSPSTAMRPNSSEEESHPALTPTDFEADPFDDRYEVVGVRWNEKSSRTGTPFSATDSTVSGSGGLGLFDAVVARRSSQMNTTPPGQQNSCETTHDRTGFATAPEPIPVSPVSTFPPAKPAPVSPLQSADAFAAEVSPTSAVSAPTSPVPARGSIPSFGGYVEEGSAISASERILREVRWGFVDLDLSKSGRRPPLSYEGDFPRGAQLSLVPDPDGHQAYASFAVEARTWQGLVVYLMWHGNSRFEAAPSDLEHDKSGRGYRASVSLDFYRAPSGSNAAVSIRPPRVRARVTLRPLSDDSTRPSSDSATLSPLPITVVSTPSFDAINPNIRLELSLPPALPIALSSLASLLADAHAAARKASQAPTIPAKSSRHGKAIASAPPPPTVGQQALLNAIELFRKLGGDQIQPAQGSHHAHDDERSLLDRMKARLRHRKGPQLLPISNDDPSEGLSLPEGALLITPFPLDST